MGNDQSKGKQAEVSKSPVKHRLLAGDDEDDNSAHFKIQIVKAIGLHGEMLSKADAYVCVCAGGEWQKTKTVKNSSDPEFMEEFTFKVANPAASCVILNLWDHDSTSSDDLIGTNVLPLSALMKGESLTFSLPMMSHNVKKKNKDKPVPTLTVSVTSFNYTGLMGEINALQDTTKALEGEVDKFSAENDKYKELNEQLEGTSKKLGEQVEELGGEVNKFTEQNNKLESEVKNLGAENEKLEETRKGLEEQVGKLGEENNKFKEQNDRLEGEVNKFSAENEKLEATRKALDEEVNKLNGEVDKFSEENKKLEETEKKLSGDIEQLNGEVAKFKGEVDLLVNTRKELEGQVETLGAEMMIMEEENKKLEETRKGLETNVASLGNKIHILDGEVKNLTKAREMLDKQVDRQEQQNEQMKTELGKLNGIQEGMREFAVQQGEDYAAFIDKLSSSLAEHAKLLEDFHNENESLKDTRKSLQVQSYLSMMNSFASWDMKGGLSTDEFQGYLELLGPEFVEVLTRKCGGGNMEEVFKKLDADGSGELNIPEVRGMLKEVIAELDE